jgi:hypothetical protein
MDALDDVSSTAKLRLDAAQAGTVGDQLATNLARITALVSAMVVVGRRSP